MRILVTDGDSRAALAVTRSLGRLGHEIIVGESSTPALAQTSRFCSDRIVYPSPFHRPEAFLHTLVSTVRQQRVDVLLPITDVATLLVTGHREQFEPACQIPFAPHATLERTANKAALVDAALQLGVPVPETIVINSPEDAVSVMERLRFPVVIKPHRSRVQVPNGWLSCSVSYAATPSALQEELARRAGARSPLLLQERIVGPGVGVFVCYKRGTLVALFGHRRLREKPPWGGVSVLSESIPVSHEARCYTEALFADLGWHGVAMAEFKIDERDGLPKLMEINGRFWGSLQLAIDAGVDFPAILLRTLDGGLPDRLPAYRNGVRSRWFWGDVDSLLIRLFSKSAQKAATTTTGGAAAIADFLQMWGGELYYDNPKSSDIRPWLFETMQWIRRSTSHA